MGVDREVKETSCKETDEQERRGMGHHQLQHSMCSKGFKGLLGESRCPKFSETVLTPAL